MRAILITYLFLLIAYTSQADSIQHILTKFKALQAGSQTYKEYKVIRISGINQWLQLAEQEWRTLENQLQSITNKNSELANTNQFLAKEINNLKTVVKSQEEVQSHLTLFGISLHRNTFVLFTLGSITGLILVCSMLWAKLKYEQILLSGKRQELLGLSAEFENLKQRALEKQMKLSRELQNERNKLEQLKLEKRQMA